MNRSIFIIVILLQGLNIFAQTNFAADFIENKGQWKEDFKYKSVIGDGTIFIQSQGYTILKNDSRDYIKILQQRHSHAVEKTRKIPVKINADMLEGESEIEHSEDLVLHSHAYKVFFKGSSENASFQPEKFTGDASNYFLGDDSKMWKTDVKTFGSIIQHDLYPGIDIRYYSSGSKMKYDLVLKPGADLSRIVMQYEGIDKLNLRDGQLIVKTSVGESKELKPYAYQIIGGFKKEVFCSYEIEGTKVKYKIKDYNKNFPLIIDPTVIFSTYSGSHSNNWGFTAAPGPDGSLYAGGIVFGDRYPTTLGAFQSIFSGGNIDGFDISLTRFSADGKSRIFSTYLGGAGDESPHSIYVDPSGSPVILGKTTSGNFPKTTTFGPLGGTDIFVLKLSADGKSLIGSTLVGGTGNDGENGEKGNRTVISNKLIYNYGDDARSEVVLDKSGNVYIASSTHSNNFFQKNSTQTYGGKQDGVLMKFSPDLSTLFYSTYIGGSEDDGAFVLAIDPISENVYVSGATLSNKLPGSTYGTIGVTKNGDIDGFISIFDKSGIPQKSTFLGTNALDIIYGIQFDEKGFPYIMGITKGSWKILNENLNQNGGKQFISKLSPDLSSYVYSTVFGTNSPIPNISPVAFLVDKCENVYVSGWGGRLFNKCDPPTFITAGTLNMKTVGLQLKKGTDNMDFYFFVMQKNAESQLYGAFYGQNGGEVDHVDGGTSRFDSKGAIYMAICANCYGSSACTQDPITAPLQITPGAVGPFNNSGDKGCNLAAVKIDFEFAGVQSKIKSFINGVFDTTGCSPVTIEFIDTIAMAKQYIWDFGDGSKQDTTATASIKHIFTTTVDKVFNVKLIAIDNNKCITRDTSYLNVRVGLKKATLDAKALRIGPCGSSVFELINTSVPAPGYGFTNTSFVWEYFDGSKPDTVGPATLTHTFSPGTHKLRLTLLDNSFCNSLETKDIYISVNPGFDPKFKPDDDTVCVGQDVNFINLSVGAIDYLWSFDNGNTSKSNSPPPQKYSTAGTKIVKLIISESSPNCVRSKPFSYPIEVKPNPVASFDYFPKIPEVNRPIDFKNYSIGADRFLWAFGDGESSKAKDTSHIFRMTDTYSVSLYSYNIFGCEDNVTQKVNTLIDPLVDVANAFTPNGDGKNDVFYVNAFGVDYMDFRIYNRWGQLVFESFSPSVGWDGRFKGVLQPMDVYSYTLTIKLSNESSPRNKMGDITLIR